MGWGLIRQLAVLALVVLYDLWSGAVAGTVAIVGNVVAVLVVTGIIRSFVIRYRYGVTVRASQPVKRPM